METAKVDIQKLQLLNDRIAQCFDALNQVRFSVHGLSHTSSQQGVPGLSQQSPFTQQNPFSNPFLQQSPFQSQGLSQQGQNPFATQGIGGIGQSVPWANPLGLAHSTYGSFGVQVPFGMTPQIPQMTQPSPYVSAPAGQTPYGIGQIPYGINPLAGYGVFPGLSHSNPAELYLKPLWADPYLAAKVAQTFPFVQLPISPIGI
jgi:hypothetical protein